MNHQRLAPQLAADLGLGLPPVAIAFVDAPPAGTVKAPAAPSACAFWRSAERTTFFAAAADHHGCPVGTMVMGFDLPKDVAAELGGLVETMTRSGYLEGGEATRIPVNGKTAKGILYGPLAQFPVEPDAVVLWLTPAQAMVWSEASGGAAWGGREPSTVFGRPACAAVPAALGTARPTLSLGCKGMRTFTEIAPDRLLAVIPGAKLDVFATALRAAKERNDVMGGFYGSRKAAFAAAQR